MCHNMNLDEIYWYLLVWCCSTFFAAKLFVAWLSLALSRPQQLMGHSAMWPNIAVQQATPGKKAENYLKAPESY